MSHHDAKQRDARDVLSPGETRRVVIMEPDVDDDGTGLTKIENVKTFVRPGKTTLGFADTVKVKIVDVGRSHAEALALSVID
jgi:predicted RNA-binding protein with RPS1 domain